MELLATFFPLILMFGLMYFLMVRPQKKQMEAKKEMLLKMQPGEEVITIGGLHGIVEEVNQAENTIVIDCEGVYLTFELSAIATVKPVKAEAAATVEEVEVDDLSNELVDEEAISVVEVEPEDH